MKVPNKVSIVCHCGLGDIFKSYFTGSNWRYIKAIKNNYPKTKVRVIAACSQNKQLKEFFKFNILVDEIIEYDWCCDKESKAKLIQDNKEYTIIEPSTTDDLDIQPSIKNPGIALNNRDIKFINRITNKKIVVIHPFSGNPILNTLPPNDFRKIIGFLVNKYKYKVIIIGGSYYKPSKIKGIHWHKETFKYERTGLVNLVDKTNVRVSAALVRKADLFIGNRSCFSSVAMATNKLDKIFLVNPHQYNRGVEKYIAKRWEGYNHPTVISVTRNRKDTIDKIIQTIRNIKKSGK